MSNKRNIYDIQQNYSELNKRQRKRTFESGTQLDFFLNENKHLRYELMSTQAELDRLRNELQEAEEELEMLRPMGIVWRPKKKKKDETKVPF